MVGWRAWKIVRGSDHIWLRGFWFGVRWPHRKPMRAHCLYAWSTRRPACPVHHTAPDNHQGGVYPLNTFGCGIYALTDAKAVVRQLNVRKDECVVGTVKLWGRLLEGPQGWQAEFAYPDELFVLHDDNPGLAGDIAYDLEEAYGVSVAARPHSAAW